VDNCPHPDGCVFANYLNDPPAAQLRLLYHKPSKVSKEVLAKIEQLGFNPLFRGKRQSSLQ